MSNLRLGEENKRVGDRRKGHIPIAVLITALGMAVAASWAVSTTFSNYRYQNITDRLKNHEDYIMVGIENDHETKVRMTQLEDDVGYIKVRVDEILKEQKNGH